MFTKRLSDTRHKQFKNIEFSLTFHHTSMQHRSTLLIENTLDRATKMNATNGIQA